MRVQRCTSLSMISRYSCEPACAAGAASGQPVLERGDAGADGGERIVDLVHDAGGELADGGELLALQDLLLRPRCHSVTSSPMVMTWVIVSPSCRIGILLIR